MLLSRSDRQNFAKSLRKSEKKVRELSLQVEEERRHADQYKEQVLMNSELTVTECNHRFVTVRYFYH